MFSADTFRDSKFKNLTYVFGTAVLRLHKRIIKTVLAVLCTTVVPFCINIIFYYKLLLLRLDKR